MLIPDKRIRTLCEAGMITPFVGSKERAFNTSYGISSYGYDVRLGDEFKVQTRRGFVTDTLVKAYDPMNLDGDEWEEVNDRIFIINPRQFVLARTEETFNMPSNVTGFVKDKSTNIRNGLTVFNTVIEAGWRGVLTLELFNNLDRPLVLRAGQGIAQIMFHESEPCEADYGDGKYQGQEGVTVAR